MGFKHFTVHPVAPDIWAIFGAANDVMYLAVGSQRSMLVDTGMGVGDLGEVVRSLTDKPLLVVNTHGHPDHAGGNAQFDETWLSPLDNEIRAEMCTPEFRKNDLQAHEGDAALELIDSIVPDRPYRLEPLVEGQVLDLGDRQYEVISVPGHTPGSVCLLNTKDKVLFTGDTIVKTPVWLFLKHSLPLQVYLDSLKKLQAREDEFDLLLPGHQPVPLRKDTLHEILQCAEEILEHPGIGDPVVTFAGKGKVWKHGDVSIIYSPERIMSGEPL